MKVAWLLDLLMNRKADNYNLYLTEIRVSNKVDKDGKFKIGVVFKAQCVGSSELDLKRILWMDDVLCPIFQ